MSVRQGLQLHLARQGLVRQGLQLHLARQGLVRQGHILFYGKNARQRLQNILSGKDFNNQKLFLVRQGLTN